MNMIKKTQHKFVAITLGAISLVLVVILGVLNLCVYLGIIYTAKENIELIRNMRGFVHSNISDFNDVVSQSPEGFFESSNGTAEYMYVRINNMLPGSTPFITTNMSDKYSADDIYNLASYLISTDMDKGFYMDMMYEVTENDLNTVVVVVDITGDIDIFRSLLKISIITITASLIVVYIFSYYLSRWAIQPVKDAFDNQRRFVSDASHELKTPLTVISANADVLESEIGENKWLLNIKNQSALMSELVHNLLDLAKFAETNEEIILNEFDLSSVVLSKSLEFECIAFESGKIFEQNITENIRYTGNEEMIKHLVSILIDNAIKHSDDKGTVRVTLTTNGHKRIFQVYNTGNGIKNSEKDKIFNRFYRSDESRSKVTGGYGLGLSIAKSIVDTHKGTISVDGEEHKWISFTVVL